MHSVPVLISVRVVCTRISPGPGAAGGASSTTSTASLPVKRMDRRDVLTRRVSYCAADREQQPAADFGAAADASAEARQVSVNHAALGCGSARAAGRLGA